MDRLDAIFQLQAELQKRYGYSFPHMSPSEVVSYVSTQSLALIDEVAEVLRETDWKPWSSTSPLNGGDSVFSSNRQSYINELADALHFLVNLALVVGCSSDELFQAFTGKNQINTARQGSNYSAGSPKCPVCGSQEHLTHVL